MKKTILLIFSLAGALLAHTSEARQVRVKGYYRKNGTYVAPHVRNVGGGSKSSSSYKSHSYGTRTPSYRSKSYGTRISTYDAHSNSNSSYRTPEYQKWQPQDTQDDSTSPQEVKEPKRSERTGPFVSAQDVGSCDSADEEAKREENEKKKQEAAKRQQEVVKQYQEEARLGNVKSQFKLAWCYEKGVGVKKDIDAAVRWYRKAAAQGDAAAQTALVRLGKR